MKIALDYDGTYDQDSELWNAFIEQADERGHTVTIVTMRSAETHPIEAHIEADIIYTDLNAKRDYCERDGYVFDVWIDDHPEWVVYDYSE